LVGMISQPGDLERRKKSLRNKTETVVVVS
jgi:hypothetical protein